MLWSLSSAIKPGSHKLSSGGSCTVSNSVGFTAFWCPLASFDCMHVSIMCSFLISCLSTMICSCEPQGTWSSEFTLTEIPIQMQVKVIELSSCNICAQLLTTAQWQLAFDGLRRPPVATHISIAPESFCILLSLMMQAMLARHGSWKSYRGW